jgi:hypothetical protein
MASPRGKTNLSTSSSGIQIKPNKSEQSKSTPTPMAQSFFARSPADEKESKRRKAFVADVDKREKEREEREEREKERASLALGDKLLAKIPKVKRKEEKSDSDTLFEMDLENSEVSSMLSISNGP